MNIERRRFACCDFGKKFILIGGVTEGQNLINFIEIRRPSYWEFINPCSPFLGVWIGITNVGSGILIYGGPDLAGKYNQNEYHVDFNLKIFYKVSECTDNYAFDVNLCKRSNTNVFYSSISGNYKLKISIYKKFKFIKTINLDHRTLKFIKS